MSDATLVRFVYQNYKGEVEERLVRPIRLWFGSTAWYRTPQWLLEGFDVDRQATRDFSLAAIRTDTWRRACDE